MVFSIYLEKYEYIYIKKRKYLTLSHFIMSYHLFHRNKIMQSNILLTITVTGVTNIINMNALEFLMYENCWHS